MRGEIPPCGGCSPVPITFDDGSVDTQLHARLPRHEILNFSESYRATSALQEGGYKEPETLHYAVAAMPHTA